MLGRIARRGDGRREPSQAVIVAYHREHTALWATRSAVSEARLDEGCRRPDQAQTTTWSARGPNQASNVTSKLPSDHGDE
jgi:hypothetical protein